VGATITEGLRYTALRGVLPSLGSATLVYLPFLIWSARNVIDDNVLFFLGLSSSGRNPIRADICAWGVGKLVVWAHMVNSPLDPMPLWATAMMALAGVVTLGAVIYVMSKTDNKLRLVPVSTALLVLATVFFGRQCLETYGGFCISLLALGWFADRLKAPSEQQLAAHG